MLSFMPIGFLLNFAASSPAHLNPDFQFQVWLKTRPYARASSNLEIRLAKQSDNQNTAKLEFSSLKSFREIQSCPKPICVTIMPR